MTRNPFHQWIQLEQPRLGTRVVFATDDFFAPKERLIEPAAPVFIADRYDDNGKWMDGWESRRKRDDGHDHCIVRLGVRGVIHGVDIDTSHFTGNYPPEASLDAAVSDEDIPRDDTGWFELLSRVPLEGDAHHYLPVADDRAVTHLRLNIFPDGGVARLRLYGEVSPEPAPPDPDTPFDLLAMENGGRALCCSDEHFGSMHNLNVAGRGANMGDGWETARRRGPGNDWVILALGNRGTIDALEIDTSFFKGNFPDRARVSVADRPALEGIESASTDWAVLLPEVGLIADSVHRFDDELQDAGPVTHVRLDIFPDGGVSRMRIYGKPTGGDL